ncbi:hypothetical protein [Acidovorax sp. LjRoot117]|uniref:hypothetical protein n=1 Tax=Acidovorax sp. LjRoot117 TaxID=3342255 RepID=UPI003ECF7093
MSKPVSVMADPVKMGARVRVNGVLAAVQPPSQADVVELRRVANNLDRLLVTHAVDVDGLINEFELARNLVQQSKG